MLNEKELIFSLVEKQKDCEFSLRFILQKQNDDWKNFFSMLMLVKKDARNEVNYDYGEFVLREKLLSLQEGLSIISGLYAKDGEKGKLVIPDYKEFGIEGVEQLHFLPSKSRYGLLKNQFPTRFLNFRVQPSEISQNWSRELLRAGLPYYPNVNEATISLFDLAVEHFSSNGDVTIAVVDYRAQIESLRLLFSKAELKLYSPEIELKNLVLKVFAKSGAKIITLPDICPESELVRFDIGFQPDILSTVLLSRQDNIKIDEKTFTKWIGEVEGIVIERPEEEILSLTKAGESQNLEYKVEVDDDTQKNDFIETVVAFLNTNRGTILVGVNDDGNVVGSQKSAEDIQKLIHDSCDPPPRDIKTQEKEILGKKIVIIEVPEGDNKPYQSKRDKNWYIRHNANDMKMERSELIQIQEKIRQQSR